MKVALVYDRVNKWGGAERVLLALHELFPEAPLYTAVYNPERAPWAKIFLKIVPSFLQNLPFAKTRHDLYAPLMPIAFESFDFSDFDLVISVTSEAAKGIITKHGTKHICYCLTPTRYLWSHYQDYFHTPLCHTVSSPLVAYLRHWDKIAAHRPDIMVGISKNVAGRIKKYYGREVEVVYPPVMKFPTSKFQFPNKFQKTASANAGQNSKFKTGYFLVVSRLVPYKKVDLVIECFNRLKWPLVVVGTGSEYNSLRRKSKSKNTEFVGYMGDEELADYYANCRALIFPQDEDFGLTPLEAQSFGKPVIAYKAGGALETIITGKTGVFFEKQTASSLEQAVKKFNTMQFSRKSCINNANRFKLENFHKEFGKLVEKSIAQTTYNIG